MTENQVFQYTVSKLIEALSSFPPDTPVLTSGYENGFESIQQPVLKELVHKPNNPYYDGEYQLVSDGDSEPFQAVLLPRLERE